MVCTLVHQRWLVGYIYSFVRPTSNFTLHDCSDTGISWHSPDIVLQTSCGISEPAKNALKAANEAGSQIHLSLLHIQILVDLSMVLDEFFHSVKEQLQVPPLEVAYNQHPCFLVYTEIG